VPKPPYRSLLWQTLARRRLIDSLKVKLRQAQEVELCFMLDGTGSMGGHINAVKAEFRRTLQRLKKRFPHLRLRVAFVAYRDHCDGANRTQTKDFTEDVADFERFMETVGATGGGDEAEDVFGGLEEVRNE
jgi:hypothetical protein